MSPVRSFLLLRNFIDESKGGKTKDVFARKLANSIAIIKEGLEKYWYDIIQRQRIT